MGGRTDDKAATMCSPLGRHKNLQNRERFNAESWIWDSMSIKFVQMMNKRGNRNTKRTEKHKNKMTHGKTYNKSPRRINHKATKSKTNTGTTALERSVEQTTGGLKHFYSKLTSP